MSLSEEKKALRKEITRRIGIYTEDELKRGTEKALQNLEQDTHFIEAETVLMYWSLPDEINTHHFIEKWHHSKTILLPVIGTNKFEAHVFEGLKKMVDGPYNILQPNTHKFENKIDLAVIPGRAFDQKGHRLGRGKGFYDHFLQDFSGYTIGLCFNFQLQDYIPFEPFDIAVDKVISSKVSTHLF